MIESAELERRGVADAQRALPAQAAVCGTSFFLRQHVASETSSRQLEWETSRGSNVFRRRLGASHEEETSREIGPVIPERIETAGTTIANEDSLRRGAVHRMCEEAGSDLDEPLPNHGRSLIQDEVRSALGSAAGRWRLAVPAS